MADTSKKPGKSSGWVAVGDSMDGIGKLHPDLLKQRMDQAKAIDAHIKKNGVPTAASTTVASKTGVTPKKDK